MGGNVFSRLVLVSREGRGRVMSEAGYAGLQSLHPQTSASAKEQGGKRCCGHIRIAKDDAECRILTSGVRMCT